MILRWQDLPRDALTFRNRTEYLHTDTVDNIAIPNFLRDISKALKK